jgi:hypothetical protein
MTVNKNITFIRNYQILYAGHLATCTQVLGVKQ